MKRGTGVWLMGVWLLLMGIQPATADDVMPREGKDGKLYVVSTAHLDTQWRWTIQETIKELIPATLHQNFNLFEAYPDYTFSFEGAFRYMLIKEYYPEEYDRLRQYIDEGRWHVSGSWIDAVDPNMPSSESLIRHALYGNGFFRNEFGKESVDIFLPDCFGFGYALPSIAKHTGLTGFSTQKLQWGCWAGTPFNIGRWRGVDGSEIVAAVNPGAYVSRLSGNLAADSAWQAEIAWQDSASGLPIGFKYVGVGDMGGAPKPETVEWLETAIQDTVNPLEVINTPSDQLFRDLTPEEKAQLPLFDDELIMTRHGIGCYTSQAAMKRWNRMNETLARAAEAAAVSAAIETGADYPTVQIRDAWVRFLWHQFHDDLTGTSIPQAYTFSWNDEILSQNRFASVLTTATGQVSKNLKTNVEGEPLVVFNPLAFERTEMVEASLVFDGDAPKALKAFGPEGEKVPVQIISQDGTEVTFLLLATVPSTGYAVYDIQPASKPAKFKTGLKVKGNRLENNDYRVTLNDEGNIASIFDKHLKQELLAEPLTYELLYNKPDNWPAWEINFRDVMAEPLETLGGSPEIRVVEDGPVRVAFEIVRHMGSSIYTETISLEAGEGSDRVNVDMMVDWKETERLLKVALRPTVSADSVIYDLGVGVIGRPVNTEKRYEVPAQQWADLAGGEYGVAMLSFDRYGWDHPDEKSLRLTLIHTPGINERWIGYEDQKSMDIGVHQTRFAIAGHEGNWRKGGLPVKGLRYNNPMRTFTLPKQKGTTSSTTPIVTLHCEPADGETEALVLVNAVKQAEESREIVVRLQEQGGVARSHVELQFASPVISAREVDGAEHDLGEVPVQDGKLIVSLSPFQPRAYAVTLASEKKCLHKRDWAALELDYNLDGISLNDDKTDGDLDGHGNTLAGDMLPDCFAHGGVTFVTGPRDAGKMNMLVPQGEILDLPEGEWNHLVLLAASVDGNRMVDFEVDGGTVSRQVNHFNGNIGQWNNRVVAGEIVHDPDQILPAYIDQEPVAWIGNHYHTSIGEDSPYLFAYLYRIDIPLNGTTTQVRLPDDSTLRVAAASVTRSTSLNAKPAAPLYDTAEGFYPIFEPLACRFADSMDVRISSRLSGSEIFYTLDGSVPDQSSLRYTGPIKLKETTTLRAVEVYHGKSSLLVNATYTALEQMPAIEVDESSLIDGFTYKVYRGLWEVMPDFGTLNVVIEGTMETIGLPEAAPDTAFGVVFRGFLHIPASGVYNLSTTSDDGSLLYVDDKLIVNNDGLHGADKIMDRAYLLEGWHELRVEMFQRYGGVALEASIIDPEGFESAIQGKISKK